MGTDTTKDAARCIICGNPANGCKVDGHPAHIDCLPKAMSLIATLRQKIKELRAKAKGAQ